MVGITLVFKYGNVHLRTLTLVKDFECKTKQKFILYCIEIVLL